MLKHLQLSPSLYRDGLVAPGPRVFLRKGRQYLYLALEDGIITTFISAFISERNNLDLFKVSYQTKSISVIFHRSILAIGARSSGSGGARSSRSRGARSSGSRGARSSSIRNRTSDSSGDTSGDRSGDGISDRVRNRISNRIGRSRSRGGGSWDMGLTFQSSHHRSFKRYCLRCPSPHAHHRDRRGPRDHHDHHDL
jgi:hypothetical protein